MKVFLVENHGNSPGLVYAVFAHASDAEAFADALEEQIEEPVEVEERHLWYGQPEWLGTNK